jgi:hypothetical protein
MRIGGLPATVMHTHHPAKKSGETRMFHVMSARHERYPRRTRTAAAAVASLGLLLTSLSACGNWISVTDAGRVGITVDPAGQPVIAVMTCARSTPVIGMAEGRNESDPDTEPNVERGRWRAQRAFTGVETFPVAGPGKT